MTDYRQNEINNKWVIISPRRAKRPEEKINGEKPKCPFCYGNEAMTPPEVYRIGGGKENETGWQVRVVPNKYKITEIHEVIVHSPDHGLEFENYSDEQLCLIFQTYKKRFNFYQKQGQVIIFNNTGKGGGESLEHDHSQLTVVPFSIPIVNLPISQIENIVFENEVLSVFCPLVSEWPYEVWFVPKKRNRYFGEINNREIEILVQELKNVIAKIKKTVGSFSYNYYICPQKDWYLRLIPRISIRGGFELATGIMVNVKDPQEVKKYLRN